MEEGRKAFPGRGAVATGLTPQSQPLSAQTPHGREAGASPVSISSSGLKKGPAERFRGRRHGHSLY